MNAWFESVVGPDYAGLAVWATAVIVMAILLYAFYMISRRYASGTYVAGGRNRKTRLAVVDAAAIDGHRRLVLVRRDDVEHLVMIGGPTDIVVEQHIRVTPRAIRPAEPEPPAPAPEARPTPAAAPTVQAPEPTAGQPDRAPSPVAAPMPEPVRPDPVRPEPAMIRPAPARPAEPQRPSARASTLPPLRPSPIVMATPTSEPVRPAPPPPLPPVAPRHAALPDRPAPANPVEPQAVPPLPEREPAPVVAPVIAAAAPIAAAIPIMAAPVVVARDLAFSPIEPDIDEDDIALDDALLQELELTLEGAVETQEQADEDSSLEEEMTRLLGGLAPTRN